MLLGTAFTRAKGVQSINSEAAPLGRGLLFYSTIDLKHRLLLLALPAPASNGRTTPFFRSPFQPSVSVLSTFPVLSLPSPPRFLPSRSFPYIKV